MSTVIMSNVWKHSKQKGSPLLVLIAIADNAGDDGLAFPGVTHLAKKSRLNEKTIRRIIDSLVTSGELLMEESIGKPSRFIITIGLRLDAISKTIKVHEFNPEARTKTPDKLPALNPGQVARTTQDKMPRVDPGQNAQGNNKTPDKLPAVTPDILAKDDDKPRTFAKIDPDDENTAKPNEINKQSGEDLACARVLRNHKKEETKEKNKKKNDLDRQEKTLPVVLAEELPKSDHRTLIDHRHNRIGASPNIKAESAAVKWLLAQKYTVEECIACMEHQLTDPSEVKWRTEVSWNTVMKSIGTWKQTRKPIKKIAVIEPLDPVIVRAMEREADMKAHPEKYVRPPYEAKEVKAK